MRFLKVLLVVVLLPVVLVVRLFRGRKETDEDSDDTGAVEIPEEQRMLVSATAAAERLLCLGALEHRLKLDFEFRAADDDEQAQAEIRARYERLRDWLDGEGLLPTLSADERRLLELPLGDWGKQDAIDTSWRNECIAVLSWALGLAPTFPPYDTQMSLETAATDLPVLLPSAAFRRDARLRPEDELKTGRTTAELWLWRSRTWRLMNESQVEPAELPEGMTFEKIIEMTAQKAGEEGMFQPVENDFPALGKAYARLTEEEHSTLASIATERLYAFNWLCGYATDWDAVPTNT
jgi:hypothetical protein